MGEETGVAGGAAELVGQGDSFFCLTFKVSRVTVGWVKKKMGEERKDDGGWWSTGEVLGMKSRLLLPSSLILKSRDELKSLRAGLSKTGA